MSAEQEDIIIDRVADVDEPEDQLLAEEKTDKVAPEAAEVDGELSARTRYYSSSNSKQLDATQLYLNEIGFSPLLTPEEEVYFAPKVLGIPTEKVIIKTRAKQKGKEQYQRVEQTKKSMVVDEYGAKLKVNLWDYLDTGLFLDHRKTRQIVAKKSKGKSLLNLFAYTGSVSLQAALHGASKVTTVDMSNTYLSWAQDNFLLNNLSGHKYQFVQADCLEWLKNNTNKYDNNG